MTKRFPHPLSRPFIRRLGSQLLGWAIFIAYEITALYLTAHHLPPLVSFLVYYPINIALFYAHYILLDQTFGHPQQAIGKALLLLLAELIVFLSIKMAVDYWRSPLPGLGPAQWHYLSQFTTTNLIRCLYYILLASFYWSAGRIADFRKQTIEAENKNLRSQRNQAALEVQLADTRNAYLQQQINPHLLFNTMNFIYNKMTGYSPEAAECVLLLSEILRFGFEESGPDGKISLDQETEQLENLIRINRFRFEQGLFLDLQLKGNFENARIIPLILLTLTENIFKHGNLRIPAHPAVLQLKLDEQNNLRYYSRNYKKAAPPYPPRKQTGLQNTRTRLDYSYRDKYQLDISDTRDFYELTLNIAL